MAGVLIESILNPTQHISKTIRVYLDDDKLAAMRVRGSHPLEIKNICIDIMAKNEDLLQFLLNAAQVVTTRNEFNCTTTMDITFTVVKKL